MKAAEEFDRLVRGAGRYTDDVALPGALHAAFVRSPHAHARIGAIDASAARAVPGVVAVLAAADMAVAAPFPAVAHHPLLPPESLRVPPRGALAAERVRYVGEAVALVVAEDRAAALEAAEAVAVDYDPLPAVLAPIDGDGAAAVAVHETAPDNVAMDATIGDQAAVEADLAAADRVVEVVVDLPRVMASPMEPMAAAAIHDGDTDSFDLWTPHQGHPEVQRPLATVLGLAPERLRVHALDVGGAFGSRGPAYPEHAALLLAARALGRPVAWRATRSETVQAEAHGRGNRLTARLGVDADGTFRAIALSFEADLGAWVTPVGAHIHAKNAPASVTGCYRIPSAAVRVVQRFSNTVPTGPYRGAGRPDVACAVERAVDEAARALGVDRVALRRRNMLAAGDFPWATPLGAVYDSGDYGRLLERALAAADWDGFPARRGAAGRRGRLRGIGLGLFTEVAGGGASPRDEARVTLAVDGERLVCRATVTGHSTGQGSARVFSRIAATAIGCRAEDVSVEASDGSEGLVGSGAFGSRAAVAMGWALEDTGERANAALREQAAAQFGGSPDDYAIREGAVLREGARVAGLVDVVATATQGTATMSFRGGSPSSNAFPSGCHVAEVEIDPETGTVAVVAYAAVDDCGRVLDETLAHAQVHGALAQGFGEALSERVIFSPEGQLVTATFLDYAMPRADHAPAPALAFAGTPSPNNPLGAKGIGEAGVAGAIVATTNAVLDALPPAVDRARVQMPFTPARMWALLADRA